MVVSATFVLHLYGGSEDQSMRDVSWTPWDSMDGFDVTDARAPCCRDNGGIPPKARRKFRRDVAGAI